MGGARRGALGRPLLRELHRAVVEGKWAMTPSEVAEVREFLQVRGADPDLEAEDAGAGGRASAPPVLFPSTPVMARSSPLPDVRGSPASTAGSSAQIGFQISSSPIRQRGLPRPLSASPSGAYKRMVSSPASSPASTKKKAAHHLDPLPRTPKTALPINDITLFLSIGTPPQPLLPPPPAAASSTGAPAAARARGALLEPLPAAHGKDTPTAVLWRKVAERADRLEALARAGHPLSLPPGAVVRVMCLYCGEAARGEASALRAEVLPGLEADMRDAGTPVSLEFAEYDLEPDPLDSAQCVLAELDALWGCPSSVAPVVVVLGAGGAGKAVKVEGLSLRGIDLSWAKGASALTAVSIALGFLHRDKSIIFFFPLAPVDRSDQGKALRSAVRQRFADTPQLVEGYSPATLAQAARRAILTALTRRRLRGGAEDEVAHGSPAATRARHVAALETARDRRAAAFGYMAAALSRLEAHCSSLAPPQVAAVAGCGKSVLLAHLARRLGHGACAYFALSSAPGGSGPPECLAALLAQVGADVAAPADIDRRIAAACPPGLPDERALASLASLLFEAVGTLASRHEGPAPFTFTLIIDDADAVQQGSRSLLDALVVPFAPAFLRLVLGQQRAQSTAAVSSPQPPSASPPSSRAAPPELSMMIGQLRGPETLSFLQREGARFGLEPSAIPKALRSQVAEVSPLAVTLSCALLGLGAKRDLLASIARPALEVAEDLLARVAERRGEAPLAACCAVLVASWPEPVAVGELERACATLDEAARPDLLRGVLMDLTGTVLADRRCIEGAGLALAHPSLAAAVAERAGRARVRRATALLLSSASSRVAAGRLDLGRALKRLLVAEADLAPAADPEVVTAVDSPVPAPGEVVVDGRVVGPADDPSRWKAVTLAVASHASADCASQLAERLAPHLDPKAPRRGALILVSLGAASPRHGRAVLGAPGHFPGALELLSLRLLARPGTAGVKVSAVSFDPQGQASNLLLDSDTFLPYRGLPPATTALTPGSLRSLLSAASNGADRPTRTTFISVTAISPNPLDQTELAAVLLAASSTDKVEKMPPPLELVVKAGVAAVAFCAALGAPNDPDSLKTLHNLAAIKMKL
jgi:hypothetical protein